MKRTLFVFLLLLFATGVMAQFGSMTVIESGQEPTIGDECNPSTQGRMVVKVRTSGNEYYCDLTTDPPEWKAAAITVAEGVMSTAKFKTTPWYDVTHPDYGADPTCSSDSAAAIQAAINAACAATTRSTAETFDNVASPTVFFPAGEYEVAQRLELGANCDGVTLEGPSGSTGAGLFYTEAEQGIQVGDGGTNVVNNVTIRNLKLSSNDEATASDCTFNNPAAAGTVMIDVDLGHMLKVENLDIWFDEQNTIEGLRCVKLIDTERFDIDRVRCFWTAGNDTATFSAGLEIDGDGTTRGNFTVDSFWNKWTQVGVYTNQVNNGTFRNFKATNGTAGSLAANNKPWHCIWVGKGSSTLYFEGHCEGEPDVTPTVAEKDWITGVLLDADEDGAPGAIYNVEVERMRISRAQIAFKLTGTIADQITINDAWIFNENTMATVFDLGVGVEMPTISGLVITGATTVTNDIVNGTTAESRDWIGPWATTGHTQELLYDGDFTVAGDLFTVGEVGVNKDIDLVFANLAGNDAQFEYRTSTGTVFFNMTPRFGQNSTNYLTVLDGSGEVRRHGSSSTAAFISGCLEGTDDCDGGDDRFKCDISGLCKWGAGVTAATDTNLYRSAADTLKTDDSLIVGANFTAVGVAHTLGDVTADQNVTLTFGNFAGNDAAIEYRTSTGIVFFNMDARFGQASSNFTQILDGSGAIIRRGSAVSSDFFQSFLEGTDTGDGSDNRFECDLSGLCRWGPGVTVAPDTSFSRQSAGIMQVGSDAVCVDGATGCGAAKTLIGPTTDCTGNVEYSVGIDDAGAAQCDTATNISAGDAEVLRDTTSGLQFRSLTAGANVTVVQSPSTITISSASGFPLVNIVEDLGVVCDGATTGNAALIQAELDGDCTTDGGCVLYTPPTPGTFCLIDAEIDVANIDNVRITGAGPELSRWQLISNDECTANDTPYDPCCSGLGAGTCDLASTEALINVKGTKYTENFQLDNMSLDGGNYSETENECLDGGNTRNLVVLNNWFNDCTQDIDIDDHNPYALIANNTTRNTDGSSLHLYGIDHGRVIGNDLVCGNLSTDSTAAIDVLSQQDGASDVIGPSIDYVIVGNTIHDCQEGIIATGRGGVVTGNTILLRPADCSDVTCPNYGSGIVLGGGAANGTCEAGVGNPYTCCTGLDTGECHSYNIVVSDNYVKDPDHAGISGNPQAIVSNNIIVDSLNGGIFVSAAVTDDQPGPSSVTGNWILQPANTGINNSGQVGTTVRDNTVVSPGEAGINIEATATSNVIEGNEVLFVTGDTPPTQPPIRIQADFTKVLDNTVVTDGVDVGHPINIVGAERVTVDGNTITGPSGDGHDGIVFDTTSDWGAARNNTVVDMTVAGGAAECGISLSGPEGVLVSGNRLDGNQYNLCVGSGTTNSMYTNNYGTNWVTANESVSGSEGTGNVRVLSEDLVARSKNESIQGTWAFVGNESILLGNGTPTSVARVGVVDTSGDTSLKASGLFTGSTTGSANTMSIGGDTSLLYAPQYISFHVAALGGYKDASAVEPARLLYNAGASTYVLNLDGDIASFSFGTNVAAPLVCLSHDSATDSMYLDKNCNRSINAGVDVLLDTVGRYGADPPSTCAVGELWLDTDETDDTECTTINDNVLCQCTATDTWTTLAVDIPADSIGVDQLGPSLNFANADNIWLPTEAGDQTIDSQIDYDTSEECIEIGDDGVRTNKFCASRHENFSYPNPTSSDDRTLFFTDRDLLVLQVRAVLNNGSATPTVTYQIFHDTDRSAAGTGVTTSAAVTSITTGTDATLSDTTIPADSWVWIETTAQGGTTPEIALFMEYLVD